MLSVVRTSPLQTLSTLYPQFAWPSLLADSPLLLPAAYPSSPPSLSASPQQHGGHEALPALPSLSLPAAVKVKEGVPFQDRSLSRFYALSDSGRLPSSSLSHASSASSDASCASSVLSSASSSSAYRPFAPALPPSSALSSTSDASPHSVSSAILSFLRHHFDAFRQAEADESAQWQRLLSASSTEFARAQSDAGTLHSHFDEILQRLSAVYERQGDAVERGQLTGVLREEALTAVRTIADRFVDARKAVLHLHLGPLLTSASSQPQPSPSSRPRKAKRVVAPPANSTSSKRSYFDKACVAVLKRWLAANWSDPYPASDTKTVLAAESGLSYDQVSHWSPATQR